MKLTTDDGQALALPINDDLVRVYDNAIQLAVLALKRAGHPPTEGAIERARAAVFTHALQMAAAVGGGRVVPSVANTALELAEAMAALHGGG